LWDLYGICIIKYEIYNIGCGFVFESVLDLVWEKGDVNFIISKMV